MLVSKARKADKIKSTGKADQNGTPKVHVFYCTCINVFKIDITRQGKLKKVKQRSKDLRRELLVVPFRSTCIVRKLRGKCSPLCL